MLSLQLGKLSIYFRATSVLHGAHETRGGRLLRRKALSRNTVEPSPVYIFKHQDMYTSKTCTPLVTTKSETL